MHPNLNSSLISFNIEPDNEKDIRDIPDLEEFDDEIEKIKGKIENLGGSNVEPDKARNMITILENDPIGNSGDIAHPFRSIAHGQERENTGRNYCTSGVRYSPESSQFSLGIS